MLIKQTILKVGNLLKYNEDFIRTWTIPEYICDEILHFYKTNKELHEVGNVNSDKGEVKNPEFKKSTDIGIAPENNERPFHDYRNELQKCLDFYTEDFPMANKLPRFNIVERYNIQHYKKGEGFTQEHFERNGGFNKTIRRCLVFMTYLNDLDEGGTIFPYVKRTIKAQKGKTVIFPADWTHTHVGQISQTQEKTIVTGWFSYLWD
jgi:prolyl 4-hydroxylase